MSVAESRRSVRWDIENARNNYVALVLAQGCLASASFGCVWLITHFLGAEPYGNVAAFMSAAQLAQVALWWTQNAVVRFGVQEFIETGTISRSFWSRTTVLAGNMLLFFGTLPLWLPLFTVAFKLPDEIILTIILYLFVTAVWMHLQFAMQAAKLPVRVAVAQMCERVLTLLIILSLALSGTLTWQRAAAAYVISQCLIIFFGVYSLRMLVDWRAWLYLIDFPRIKEILLFSIPIPFYSLLSPLALNYVGSIFILHYLTKTDLGVYTVAYQLYGLIMVLPTLAGNLMNPLFVSSMSGDENGGLIPSFLKDVLPALTIMFYIVSVMLVIILHYLLPVIFGSGFSDVDRILWILMSAGVIASPVLIGLFPLSMSGNSTYLQLIPAFFSSAVLVVVSFFLVPTYGLMGSAWSMLISFLTMLVIFSLMIHQRQRLGFPKTLVVAMICLMGALALSYGFHILVCSAAVIFFLLLIIGLDRYTYQRAFGRVKRIILPERQSD